MDKFICGVVVGLFIALVIIVTIDEPTNIIESETKIIPDWELVANGKVVDTIYIYKKVK